ncbi:MAG: GTPase obg [candidate division Zixibacteria bacterium RBG-1]|nr:MAG: GTPase obg [candidate division Zixibacteria bacterium RBG-1]OGC86209.1 MAG: GTPase ObgE [candidate division Zixibacteria bacterium RBG_19FT_COMBO_42_43]
MFVDIAEIEVQAGKGGNGAVSFRREKYVPKGGPDGGDGGKGGDIIIQADRNLITLMDFKYKSIYKTEDGSAGMGAKKTGKEGKDLVLKVPAGTTIKDAESGEPIADLTKDKEQIVIVRGGRGGRGNTHFKSSTDRAPRKYEEGELGEKKKLILELKLLADVGIVGFPNAGKSTLLKRITQAEVKIANYPFTTLVPNLGVARLRDYGSFILADIPGILEGAHKGKGLGLEFLRHIQRTKILLYLIDGAADEIKNQLETLKKELKLYDPSLVVKPSVIAVNKIDVLPKTKIKKMSNGKKRTAVYPISALTGEGVDKLLKTLEKKLGEILKNAD